MQMTKRFIWLLVLALVAMMAVKSVSMTDAEQKDSFQMDDWDEGIWDEDYESEDLEGTKQEFGQQQPSPSQPPSQPPPPGPYPLPPPPMIYAQPPMPQYMPPVNYEQPPPQYAAPMPPPVLQNYTVTEQYPQPQPQYQLPAQPNYTTAPQYPQPQPQYQLPAQPNYTTTTQYPQPQPQHQQPPQYQPAPQPQYQQPQQQQYQQPPAYQPQPQVAYKPPQANYTAPAVKPPAAYKPQQVNYTAPVAKPPVYQPQPPMYVKPIAYNATVNLVAKPPQYSPQSLAKKYSLADLAPFTTPFGYRSNHWTLHYYKFIEHQVCPKANYQRGPSQRDIEEAFAFALSKLGRHPNGASQYMDMGSPSFAARHQIASYLSQKNARMDEEGLLVEFVSVYLAKRLCMSKWDRQRYLPSLTKLVGAGQFPQTHSCSQYYSPSRKQWQPKNCYANKYRTFDGFCNNPQHPYWGKANVCHIRLLSPDYSDGISMPRESHNKRYDLPNPRLIANVIHNDVPLEGPYNLMKMQWGQFINHDISNTALSSYDGLVDCCRQPGTRGCWPIVVPPGDRFYGPMNVTCLNFIRSGVCPTCQLGPRQQTNKNTAFLDASHIYGNSQEQANQLRAFVGGLLKTSSGRNGEQLLPVSSLQEQCVGQCYHAGDARVNQHPALTALHVLLLRNHNRHAQALGKRHPNWNDETLFQEARRLNIGEYQMITYAEYLPIVFGPVLSSYYRLTPQHSGYTQFDYKVDPTTWNEYTTAACRFGHSQITSLFSLTTKIMAYGQQNQDPKQQTYRLKEWYFRPSLLGDGMLQQIVNGLLARPSLAVDPWLSNDVRNHLYQSPKESWGGDLAATNIWRGRDHGLPGYVHYVEYCFNFKVRGWKDLQTFIPPYTLGQLRKLYKVVENIDLFVGGLSERHFPGADIGPTFACINGIQYHHLKFGDRYFFEHGGQAGSFTPQQLADIKRSSLARLLCRTGNLPAVPQYAFLQPSMYNPLVNCSQLGDINYNLF